MEQHQQQQQHQIENSGSGQLRLSFEHQSLTDNISSNNTQNNSNNNLSNNANNTSNNNHNSSSSNSQQPFLVNNVDVRMKRHPELQPYQPCDRFVPTTNSSTPSSSNRNKNAFGGSTNCFGTMNGPTSCSSINYANGNNKPKKYVSMTRLNQLAQPKRTRQQMSAQQQQLQQQHQKPQPSATSTIPPSSLTSSNATSTTASSLTSNRNYSCSSGRSSASQTITPSSSSQSSSTTNNRSKQPTSHTSVGKGPIGSSTSRQQGNSVPSRASTNQSSRLSTASNKSVAANRTSSVKQTSKTTPQQQALVSGGVNSKQATAQNSVTRRLSRQSLKESTPLRSDITFDRDSKPEEIEAEVAPISPIQSSKSTIEVSPKVERCEEDSSTPAAISTSRGQQQRPSLADEGKDSVSSQKITSTPSNDNNHQQPLQNISRISNLSNDNSANFASFAGQPNEDAASLAEQLSELSTNDRHFMSAVSELLVPEKLQESSGENTEKQRINGRLSSETKLDNLTPTHAAKQDQSQSSTVTVNFSDRNPDSLIRELREDAIAMGYKSFDLGTNDATTPRVSTTTEATLNDELAMLDRQHESTMADEWQPNLAFGKLANNQLDGSLGTPKLATNGSSSKQEEKMRRQKEEEEDLRRLKIEEELREASRREEEERAMREKLVENIMSRFSSGSP